MRNLLILLVLLLSAAALAAQPPFPAGVPYAVANNDVLAVRNRLMGFSDAGALLYDFTGFAPAATNLGSVCMNKHNDGFIVGDAGGFHRIRLAGGSDPFQPLPGGAVYSVDVDENGGVVWCAYGGVNGGEIWRQRPGLPAVLLGSLPGVFLYSIAWNGATGGYVAVEWAIPPVGASVRFMDRAGVTTMLVPGITYMTGIDWDPLSGDMIISRRADTAPNSGIVRVTQAGAVTYVFPLNAAVDRAISVEVIENPIVGLATAGGRLAGVESGGAPRHIYRKSVGAAAATAIYTANDFGPVDLEVVRSRQVWGLNRWVGGSTGRLSVNFGPSHALEQYRLALSFGHQPGIDLGPVGHVHLNADPLFAFSLACIPPFNDFCGVLDGQGRAPVNPSVNLPVLGAPVRVYAGAITIGAAGITCVSNCFGVTIQ